MAIVLLVAPSEQAIRFRSRTDRGRADCSSQLIVLPTTPLFEMITVILFGPGAQS
ncbi:MAG: hypothetical protein HY556_12040 [Euryarchaeota archaeon]|nr:hypothetical protein [Euryarchaeota archaeon]